jgi:Gpi18-like mannosyltransferase
MNFIKQTSFFYYTLAIIAIALLIICFLFDGTGGGGDSVYHFQYAKFAAQHPENFFNHWAKPLYTIFAFPFAQFGFVGIKVFNVLMSLVSAFFTYKILQHFKTANAQFIAIVLFSITLFVNVTVSGLTEPFSAALLMVSIYFLVKDKTILGLFIISFMPFIRSEGLIILGVFFIYLIFEKKYRLSIWLISGHVIMSVIGSFYYHDLLWVFNKIPYAHVSSVYGIGTWTHFIEQLYFQVGLIEYALFFVGCLAMVITLIKLKGKMPFVNEKLWLVYGCFFAFFIAHTSFWALGIFNSMGLSRVFVSVMPLMAIIALDGLNFIENYIVFINNKLAIGVKYILIILIIVFPFLKTPAAYKIPDDFELDASQVLTKNIVVPYLNTFKPNKTIVIADISIPLFYNLDPFDKSKVKMIYDVEDFNSMDSNTLLVWDTWLSVMEFGLTLEKLNQCDNLKMDTIFHIKSKQGRVTEYAVFSKR